MIATIKISNSISISKEYSTILALHSYNSVGLTGQFKTNDQNQTRDIILSVVLFFPWKKLAPIIHNATEPQTLQSVMLVAAYAANLSHR